MPSFGENLRRERELRGIDLRDVSDATKISMRFLQALEQDRVDILPGGIFPKAFVRQYARHVGLDADRVVAEFVYATGGESPRATEPRDATPSRNPALVVAATVVIAAGALGWHLLRGGGSARTEPVATLATPAPALRSPGDRVYPPPTPNANEAVAAPVMGVVVKVSARKDCWVGARVDGVKTLDRVVSAGQTEVLEAKNEVVLSVGNAGGVSMTINGRPAQPLGADGEVKRNVVITRENMASLVAPRAAAAPAAAGSPAGPALRTTPVPAAAPAETPAVEASPSPAGASGRR